MIDDKKKVAAVDSSYKSFWKSPAGQDLREWLKTSSDGAVNAAKAGVGVATTQDGPQQVQLTTEQQLGMLQRSFAYDQVEAYIERRVNRGKPKLVTE